MAILYEKSASHFKSFSNNGLKKMGLPPPPPMTTHCRRVLELGAMLLVGLDADKRFLQSLDSAVK